MPSNPGPEIGSTTDVIDFWTSTTGHNNLHAENFVKESDSISKANITSLNNGLSVINQLKTYSYNMKNDSVNYSERTSYGLLAQEVENILPSLVHTSKGIKMLDYDGFIPFLILAIQEQQAQIETLQAIAFSQEKEIVSLNEIIVSCCGVSNPKSTNVEDIITSTAVLFQNAPNPFSESTIIKFIIPEEFETAHLIIHKLNGVEIKSFTITESDEGNITISGAELNPGMYLYTLIVGNEIVDTKRMILTQ